MMATAWIEDSNGNKCSIEHFGSKEAAQIALDSLKDCKNCTNCTDCTRCSGCTDCSGCSHCWGCSNCRSDCWRCSRCTGCTSCWRCSRCTLCWDCSGCTDCSLCSGSEIINGSPPHVPVIANIHQTIYAAASRPGSLNMDDVHQCENTHCRGGWAVTLAGVEGRALEQFYNWELAAMLIYDASDPTFKINPARFYDSNDDALADMKRLADIERTKGMKVQR